MPGAKIDNVILQQLLTGDCISFCVCTCVLWHWQLQSLGLRQQPCTSPWRVSHSRMMNNCCQSDRRFALLFSTSFPPCRKSDPAVRLCLISCCPGELPVYLDVLSWLDDTVGHLVSSSCLIDSVVVPPVCAGLPQDVRPTSASGLQSKRRVHVALRLVCMLLQG